MEGVVEVSRKCSSSEGLLRGKRRVGRQWLAHALIAATFIAAAVSCSDGGDGGDVADEGGQVAEPVGQTVIMYMPWSGNLLSAFEANIADMQTAVECRGGLGDKRLMVFLAQSGGSAFLMEMKHDGGKCSLDTLDAYTFSTPSYTTAYGLHSIFNDITSMAPADGYALIIGAHAMGWLPKGTEVEGSGVSSIRRQAGGGLFGTRYFGHYSDEDYQTDLSTLAEAIGMTGIQMDYILFDDCYMANMESVYELRDAAKYIIASACEVILYGVPYATAGQSLLDMDLEGVCDDFYDYYSQSQSPYATLSLIDCGEVESMAGIMADINSRCDFDSSAIGGLQVLDGITPAIFFDFGDYVEHLCGADTALYNDFRSQLDLLVPYSRHTDAFYSAYNNKETAIKTFSGLSVSAPTTNANAAGRWTETAWCLATGE